MAQKKLVLLFAVLAIIVSPLLIGFGSGSKTSIGYDFTFTRQNSGPKTPIIFYLSEQATVLDIMITPSETDKWQVSCGVLRMTLANIHQLHPPIFSGIRQLEQDIVIREGSPPILEIAMDKHAGPFRVLVFSDRYRIEWLTPGLRGKRIAIDPGHGGIDVGAVGLVLGIKEKDITLAVSLELRRLLEKAGAEVFMTRETDKLVSEFGYGENNRADLWKRRDLVQEYAPHFYVSVHNNSWSDRFAHGLETFYNPASRNAYTSRQAAHLVHQRLLQELGRRDRGIKPKGDAILQVHDFAAVLVELLFLSNPEEERIIASPDFPARAARAIFLGISDYFGETGGD
jgi:N-acetylmuramoyl-L-alanine amidase